MHLWSISVPRLIPLLLECPIKCEEWGGQTEWRMKKGSSRRQEISVMSVVTNAK